MEYFNFWSKFLSFKGVSHVMSDEVEKNLNFQVSLYDEGRFKLNILTIDIGINFECFWTISIFGRNSCVSKALAHEMSDEVEEKLIFQVSLYDEGISL